MLAVADRTGHLDASLVRRVEFSSNQEVLRALRNGIIEAGALMLDETLLAMDDGGDLVALAALDSSIGSDAVLARPPDSLDRGAQGKARRRAAQFRQPANAETRPRHREPDG